VKQTATCLYYILPNFHAFDLKVHAIYGVPMSPRGIALTVLYGGVYVSILLMFAVISFDRREMK
jgi:hypothetical protein